MERRSRHAFPRAIRRPHRALHGNLPVAVGLGTLPAGLVLPIPASLRADVVFQGFGLSLSGGSLSNPLAFAIR